MSSPSKRLDEIEQSMRVRGPERVRDSLSAEEARAQGIDCPRGTDRVVIIDNPGGKWSHEDQLFIFVVRESTHPLIDDDPDEDI